MCELFESAARTFGCRREAIMSWPPRTNADLWPTQLTALQTLYIRFSEKFSAETGEGSREERLSWASWQIGREIDSFKRPTNREAAQLIGFLKKVLGQDTVPQKRRSREAAMARDTAGPLLSAP